ncbi:AAA family ATPase, partial [Aeromonas caviae]
MLEIKHKLAALLEQLNEGLVDRDEAMKLALLSLLAGENILLVGPPGTAKSLISRQVAKALKDDDKEGSSHFEYLLTKFSTPEEIFGPLSISKLKEDCSGQLNPDTQLSRFSASAGGIPSLC